MVQCGFKQEHSTTENCAAVCEPGESAGPRAGVVLVLPGAVFFVAGFCCGFDVVTVVLLRLRLSW